jgi:hypothetical protein
MASVRGSYCQNYSMWDVRLQGIKLKQQTVHAFRYSYVVLSYMTPRLMLLSTASDRPKTDPLQLLVFQLAFQLLRLGHLPDRLVEVVLIDRVSVVLDREETTGIC